MRASGDAFPIAVTFLLCIVAVHAASPLKCYDCLSKALPECADEKKSDQFEVMECKSDEKYCSVLTLKDAWGQSVVSRQCTRGEEEREDLRIIIEGSVGGGQQLTVEAFTVCEGNLCNGAGLSLAPAMAPANVLLGLASAVATAAGLIAFTPVLLAHAR